MGAVHGVHLKYVAISALSAYSAWTLHPARPAPPDEGSADLAARLAICALWYMALVNAFITVLMVTRRGEHLLGKDAATGAVPLWSHVAFAGFHAPTWLYTWVHTWLSERRGVPVASEVAPGWWIGGRYANRLRHRWAATVDLTVEFSEGCRDSTRAYLNLPCWDGTPPSARDIERAARFASDLSENGDIMVHCAHGRGRSTCVMVACLVRSGAYPTWQRAFDAVRLKRKGVMLNRKMRRALTEWEGLYGSPHSSPRESPVGMRAGSCQERRPSMTSLGSKSSSGGSLASAAVVRDGRL
jgi:protein-tyrosine phosphatase